MKIKKKKKGTLSLKWYMGQIWALFLIIVEGLNLGNISIIDKITYLNTFKRVLVFYNGFLKILKKSGKKGHPNSK